jgi:hypothetical protein
VAVGVLALGINFLPAEAQTVYVFGGLLLILGFGQAGIRLGRKTYFLEIAPEDDRPLLSAVINLVIGSLTLLSGLLGVLIDQFSLQFLIMVITVLPVIGVILSRTLPQVGNSD